MNSSSHGEEPCRMSSYSGLPLTITCHPLIVKLQPRHSHTCVPCHQILHLLRAFGPPSMSAAMRSPHAAVASALVQMCPHSRASQHLVPQSQAAHQDPSIACPTVPATECPRHVPRLSHKLPAPGVIKTCLAALAHRGELLLTLVLLTRYLPSFSRVECYTLTEQAVKFATA